CHCSPALNLGFPAARISGGWLMRRRNFLSVLGGAAAWPLAARAQQGERMRRIGVLMNKAADDAEGRAQVSAFEGALQQRGWKLGGNLQIDYRWSAGDASRYRSYAADAQPWRSHGRRCGLHDSTDHDPVSEHVEVVIIPFVSAPGQHPPAGLGYPTRATLSLSFGLLPAIMRSACAVARPLLPSPTSTSTETPCASMIA